MCDQSLNIATVEAEPKSLTNIYYDCLERIFDFLDLESLINVAGTCKRLQIAAAAKYADDYGHTSVWLHYGRDDINFIGYYNTPMYTSITVRGLKFCLTFLRCFGTKILDLSIDSMWGTRNGNRYVDRYINQYCAYTLISNCITYRRSMSREIFIRPFKAIEKLSFCTCNLGDQLPKFVDWFPNLQHLTFSSGISIDGNAIAVFFPYLEHLAIAVHGGSDSINTESATKFLRANQQLQTLRILLNAEFEKLLDMISGNKSIFKLKVLSVFPSDLSVEQVNRFAKEHPLLEELHFEFSFEVDDAIALIRQLNSLKRFEFRVKNQTDCDNFLSKLDVKWKHEIKLGTSVIIYV